jgi:hypothetical protein
MHLNHASSGPAGLRLNVDLCWKNACDNAPSIDRFNQGSKPSYSVCDYKNPISEASTLLAKELGPVYWRHQRALSYLSPSFGRHHGGT